MERHLVFFLAETPVHAGGSESLGAVDLPIQRESTTGLPVIWGQSLKGALRQAARDAGEQGGWSAPQQEAVFGSAPPGSSGEVADDEGVRGSLTKGSVSVGDAQLLLFPAATLRNAFAWVTSPLLLSRLGRKATLLRAGNTDALAVHVPDGRSVGTAGWKGEQVLGAFIENVTPNPDADRIGAALSRVVCPRSVAFDYTRTKMSADVVVTHDEVLKGLTQMGTDIVARVQLKPDEKTVKNLFYSEHLPAETVLAAVLAGPADHLRALVALLDDQPLQLGGDETIGKGVLWCRVQSAQSLGQALRESTTAHGAGTAPQAAAPSPPAPVPAGAAGAGPSPASIPRSKRG